MAPIESGVIDREKWWRSAALKVSVQLKII